MERPVLYGILVLLLQSAYQVTAREPFAQDLMDKYAFCPAALAGKSGYLIGFLKEQSSSMTHYRTP